MGSCPSPLNKLGMTAQDDEREVRGAIYEVRGTKYEVVL